MSLKSVMIVFNQANTERVEYMLDVLGIKGFTFFEQVQGRGTNGGEPRRGTHAWPEMNSCVITIVEEEQLPALLESVKKLDMRNEEVGVRAFVWDIVATVQALIWCKMHKNARIICIIQKKVVLLHREMNEGTETVSSLYTKGDRIGDL